MKSGRLFIIGIIIILCIPNMAVAENMGCIIQKLKASERLWKSYIKCYAKELKRPGSEIGACNNKASHKFMVAWEKAGIKAAKKEAYCETFADTVIEDILSQAVENIYTPISQGLDAGDKNAVKLGRTLLKAIEKRVSTLLKAQGANLKKSDAAKLQKAIAKAQKKFTATWDKAMVAALKKGVAYTGPSANDVKTIMNTLVADILNGVGGGGGDDNIATDNTPPIANAGIPQTANKGEVVTLDGSMSSDEDGDSLNYDWTLVSKPYDSAVYFSDTNTANPTLTNTMPGEYVAQLIVDDGTVDSESSMVSVTVNDISGPAPARAPVQAEIDYLTQTAIDNIPQCLKAPSTFQLVGTPTWSYYFNTGQPDEGAVSLEFDSQNSFGAMIRTKAICPANWDDRGFWRNTMNDSLCLCNFY